MDFKIIQVCKFLIILFSIPFFSCSNNSSEIQQNIRLRNISSQLIGQQSTILIKPVQIIVEDPQGNTIPNIELEVSEITGGGIIISTSKKSDQNGVFSIEWKLGLDIFQNITVISKEFPDVKTQIKAQTTYKYKLPLKQKDGWEVDNILEMNEINSTMIFEGIDKIRLKTYKEIHSFILVKGNKLILDEYFDGHDSNGNYINYDINTPHEQQSASKSFRSILTGIAIEEGFINNTESQLFSFFPNQSYLAKTGKENITIDHILTMSSGLSWNEWIAPPNDLSIMYSKSFKNWHIYVLERPLAFTPGTRFVYNTGASIMLNRIIENASSMTIAEFTKKYFMDKTESTLLPNNENLQAKKLPRDMAKLGAIYLNKGKWKKTKIVSEEWIQKSFELRYNVPEVGASYGYQWWNRDLRGSKGKTYNCYYASGNGGQFIMIIKELDLVAVFTGGNFGGGGHAYEIMQKHVLPAFN